jgi:hypothetical protein
MPKPYQPSLPRIAFDHDGTVMMEVGQFGDIVNVYKLRTAWDISTACVTPKITEWLYDDN